MRSLAAGRESTSLPPSARRNITPGWAMARLVIASTTAARSARAAFRKALLAGTL
jgi:hypothetical protein